jgi:hypothetical protein
MRDEVSIVITGKHHPAISTLDPGDMLKGSLYAKSVIPLADSEVDVLARLDDGAAIVSAKYGKGEAMLRGILPWDGKPPRTQIR